VKRFRQLVRIEKQVVRTEREVEGAVAERETRELGCDVPSLARAGIQVIQKLLYGGHAGAAELFRRFEFGPRELRSILPDLFENLVVRGVNSRSNLSRREAVKRVARHDPHSAAPGSGVEAGGTVCAADDSQPKILFLEGEHPAILVKGAPPRDDVFKGKRHFWFLFVL
jgi:hypothetical protein